MDRRKATSLLFVAARSPESDLDRHGIDDHEMLTSMGSKSMVFLFVVLLLAGCAAKSEKQPSAPSESVEFTRYMVEGAELYNLYCGNCHQHNGQGLGRVFPPLNDSDYMESNFEQVICLIKNGQRGEIIVNGISFNEPMPVSPHLTSLELAQVTTFIYNSWSHKRGMTSIKEVEKVLMDFCE